MPIIKNALELADRFAARVQSQIGESGNSLISLVLHGLFADDNELNSGLVNPEYGCTIQQLELLIQKFLEANYQFILPSDLLLEDQTQKKRVILSFDDGYFNNLGMLPLIPKYGVCAAFFVSAGFVESGLPFWWDVIYRHRASSGRTMAEISEECAHLKTLSPSSIDAHLRRECGEKARCVVGDIDRPMSPGELRACSENPGIEIGNHTFHHAALSWCDDEVTRREIHGAQDLLEKMTGKRPVSIAYPYGMFHSGTLQIARSAGLKVGFSVDPAKEYPPFAEKQIMRLGRFAPSPIRAIKPQFDFFRSDIMLYQRYKQIRKVFNSSSVK
jgi:peptidoglycan/xylan/chitin deacetylase (PgdA/CDA1 family)